MMMDLVEKCIVKEESIKLNDLLREINHEMNNSLTTILGFTQLVMNNDKLDDDLKGYMNIIYEAALDSKHILSRVKELQGHKSENTKVEMCLNDLVESSMDMAEIKCDDVCKIKDIDIEFVKNLKAKNFIHINPREIREVILNMLLNAVDSIERNGKITVETKDCENGVTLEITDNGKGMDDETLNQLFNPYFTTKGENGTGLGMSISKKFIEDHGGKIEVESKVGEGTKFKISFKE